MIAALDGRCIRLVEPQVAHPRPVALRCVGFVTPPHRAAAGGPRSSGGRGWPWRTGTSSGRGGVSEYIVETNHVRKRNVDGSRESTRRSFPFSPSRPLSIKIHRDADPHKRATNAWSNTGTHIAAALPASLETGCATRERQVPFSYRPRGKAGARGRGGADHAALPELTEPHRRGGKGPRAPRRRRRATPPQPCP